VKNKHEVPITELAIALKKMQVGFFCHEELKQGWQNDSSRASA
jgi:hypothetical protein